MLLSVRYSIVWSCILLSVILETIGRSEIDLKILGSVLVPFLYRRLTFACLQYFGKWDCLMDKIQICIMGLLTHWQYLSKIYQIWSLFRQLWCCMLLEDLRLYLIELLFLLLDRHQCKVTFFPARLVVLMWSKVF